MNLANVMDELAIRLDGIEGLQVFPYPPDEISPPTAFVSYPESYEFDQTYGRGSDRMTIPVVLLVGKASDRASRIQLAEYCDGSGVSSIKQVVESGSYSAFHDVRVTTITFNIVSVAGTDYAGAIFDLDIFGSGS